MAVRPFNIPDDVYVPFQEKYRGQMSKIVTNFIIDLMQLEFKDKFDIVKKERELEEYKKEASKLSSKITNLELNIVHLRKQAESEKQLKLQESEELNQLIMDQLEFYKSQGNLTELKYKAEKAGFKSVEEYLYEENKKVMESKKDDKE